MRKGIKFILIFASAIIAIGIVVIVLAFKFDLTVDASGKTINNEYVIDKTFTNIDIDVKTTNILICKSENSECKIECKEKTKIYNDIYVEDDTLKIKQKDKRKWYEEIMDFDVFKIKVTIYLPNDIYNNLTVDSSTGSFKIYDGFTFNDINIDLSTGNVKFENVISNNLDIDTSTGDIKLFNCDFNKFKLDTSNGDVEATLKTAKSVKAHTSTGSVKIQNDLSGEPTCYVSTSTGDIKIIFDEA